MWCEHGTQAESKTKERVRSWGNQTVGERRIDRFSMRYFGSFSCSKSFKFLSWQGFIFLDSCNVIKYSSLCRTRAIFSLRHNVFGELAYLLRGKRNTNEAPVK